MLSSLFFENLEPLSSTLLFLRRLNVHTDLSGFRKAIQDKDTLIEEVEKLRHHCQKLENL